MTEIEIEQSTKEQLVEWLKYLEAIERDYDGEDKEVREEIRATKLQIQNAINERTY